MRSLVIVGMALAACAPTKVGTPEEAPTVSLTELVVSQQLRAGVPYPATLQYDIEGQGDISFREACFTWSGEGPYCFDVYDNRAANQVRASLRTGNPNEYLLAGFVRYYANGYERESNTVDAMINVR